MAICTRHWWSWVVLLQLRSYCTARKIALSFPPSINIESLNQNVDESVGIIPEFSVTVPRWCNDEAPLASQQYDWNCQPMEQFTICVYAGSARQYCMPMLSQSQPSNIAGAPRIDLHHLPVGEVDLVAKLMWISKQGQAVLVTQSPPIRVTRDVPWNSDRAAALSQLLLLERNKPTTGLRLGLLRHGPMLYNVHDAPAGESLELLGEWEECVVRLLVSVLKEGDLVLDIGAHLGSFTIPLARAVGVSGTVLSFEPQVDLFQSIHANLALNGIFNVEARRVALAETRATHEVNIRDASSGRSNFGAFSLNHVTSNESSPPFSKHGRTTTIDVVPLDSEFHWNLERSPNKQVGDRCPRLIKMDVEGFETSVLRGGRQMIALCKPLLYVENQCRSNTQELIQELTTVQNYDCFWDPAPYYSPDNVMNYSGIIEGTSLQGISLNMLCLPINSSSPYGVGRDLWLILGDVTAQLSRVDQEIGYFVENYNPVKVRSDVGSPHSEMMLEMAFC